VVLAPVPESATDCGLLLAASVKFNVALRVPVAVGENVTLTVQLDKAARLVPQILLEIAKSPAFVPEMAMLLMLSAVLPLFVRVVVFAPPILPSVTLAQVRLVGLTEALPPVELVPVPESVTVCGLFVELSMNSKLAVRVPAAVGPKITFAVQLAETARVVPQVLLNIVKSGTLVPVMEMPLIVSVVVPPLVRVTTF
jgi:hypothetical protein